MTDVQVEDLPGSDQPDQQSVASLLPVDSVQHLTLAQRFEVESPSKTEDRKLREVWEYARGQSATKDMQDIMWQVVHLEGVLGAPRLGESRLDRLYRYCKLKRGEAQIQAELKNVTLGSHNLRQW